MILLLISLFPPKKSQYRELSYMHSKSLAQAPETLSINTFIVPKPCAVLGVGINMLNKFIKKNRYVRLLLVSLPYQGSYNKLFSNTAGSNRFVLERVK